MGRTGNPYFHFQQFSVWQDRCAMKVGVDGILLGAWASVQEVRHVLDIGTGTGLIALMLAQRTSKAHITAIEIDADASTQAQENVARSPWADRITVKNVAYQHLSHAHPYELVVANPPFYEGLTAKTPRMTARHQTALSPIEIIKTIQPHLQADGRIALIIPFTAAPELIATAMEHDLFLARRTNVRPVPESAPKRSLLELSCQPIELIETDLTLELRRHQYSPEYEQLIRAFFLKFRPK